MAINDPEYYVAIEFLSPAAVTTENLPEGCDVTLVPAKALDPALEERPYSLGPEVLDLPRDLAAAMKWVQGAQPSCAALVVVAFALSQDALAAGAAAALLISLGLAIRMVFLNEAVAKARDSASLSIGAG